MSSPGWGQAEFCPQGTADGFSAGRSFRLSPARGGAASGVGCRLRTRVWLRVIPDSCPPLGPGPCGAQRRGRSGRMRPKRRPQRKIRGSCPAVWTPPQSSRPMTWRAPPGAWPRAARRPSVLASCDAAWIMSQRRPLQKRPSGVTLKSCTVRSSRAALRHVMIANWARIAGRPLSEVAIWAQVAL